MGKAPGRIRARRAASIRCRVSGVAGVCRRDRIAPGEQVVEVAGALDVHAGELGRLHGAPLVVQRAHAEAARGPPRDGPADAAHAPQSRGSSR